MSLPRLPPKGNILETKYTAKQMKEYAAKCVALEREACANVAEAYEPRCDTCPSGVANAIRSRGVNHGQN
jgi:hypothetical protein